ncbi:phage terminase large subunit [Pediococcus ethanolidurans]|uniref:phage terminase large subunit n=1 Tax=Pediococcus ethanolidurans TaxID=319653 RepID=UPI002953F228|nr:phage terminase large subunit [Pediococcus ethanolidurans]
MVKTTEFLAPSFYQLFWDVYKQRHFNYWLKGGRGSTKSSFVSLMVVLGIMTDPQANAIILRKVAGELRESVYDQYLWAVDVLGAYDKWKASVSPRWC